MEIKFVIIMTLIFLFLDISHESLNNKSENSSVFRFIQKTEIQDNESQLTFKEQRELEKVN